MGTIGFIKNYNISKLFEKIYLPILTCEYAVITCIDSNRDLQNIFRSLFYNNNIPWLNMLDYDNISNQIDNDTIYYYNNCMICNFDTFMKLMDLTYLFSKYDEVLFFNQLPVILHEYDLSITSEEPITESILNPNYKRIIIKNIQWLIHNKCILALGDGDGLNYIDISANLVDNNAFNKNSNDLIEINIEDILSLSLNDSNQSKNNHEHS